MAEFGYAGEILKVNLSDRSITKLPTADYADRFLGGRGIAVRLYWDMVSPQTGAFDPDNCFLSFSGPAAGFNGLASSRWIICGKSAATDPEAFSYANLGGGWGNRLKRAGYDGLVVQGKSDKPVYLVVQDGAVEIKDASHLWGKSAFEASDSLKAELGRQTGVMAIGPAAENLIAFSTVLADEGASGSGGLGSILGAKKLKAVAVAGNKRPKAADPERLRGVVNRLYQLRDDKGKQHGQIPMWAIAGRTRNTICYGCGIGCSRQVYTAEGGQRFKSFCQASGVYTRPSIEYYGKWTEVALLGTRLCDGYGFDTNVMIGVIEWLSACYREGLLRDKETGLPLSQIGSSEFIETLTRKIAFREDFGDILARGLLKAADSVGDRAKEMVDRSVATRAGEKTDYDPRLIQANALLYATEPRKPIQQLHEIGAPLICWARWQNGEEDGFFSTEDFRRVAAKFWGGEIAADFSTYEGKALAAKMIQDRVGIQESLVLCDLKWPVTWTIGPEDHSGDPALESKLYSAITGKETDEAGMNKAGERIVNLQRAILLRQGWGGREGDKLMDYLHEEPLPDNVFFDPGCLAPGKDGEVISMKGAVLAREDFEKMKSEYYELRGWDVETGFPTASKLKELGLGDVAIDLEKRGLLG
jgi:aldehyde:ferredoxin oxidoreductase